MCQVHTGAYISLLPPGKPTTPLVTQGRLQRIYCTEYLSLRIRTTDPSQLEKRNKEKKFKLRKLKKRGETQKSTRQEEEARKGKEKNESHTSRPLELAKDGIGLMEYIKCIINDTGEGTQHGAEVRAVSRYLVTAIGRTTTF